MSQKSKNLGHVINGFQENRFYEIETLTHNHVNTISDKCNLTSSSDLECDLVPLTEV